VKRRTEGTAETRRTRRGAERGSGIGAEQQPAAAALPNALPFSFSSSPPLSSPPNPSLRASPCPPRLRGFSGGFSSSSGLTLLELLLVLFLLAILAGISLGFLSTLDLGRRAARGLVKSVVRSAANTAVASGARSEVRIDPARGELHAQVLRVVGTWHFERSLAGAFGIDGAADAGLFTAEGYLGSALAFAGKFGATATVPVQHDSSFDLRDGFALECAVSWDDSGGGRILSIGETCSLELGGAGEVRGRFTAAGVRDGEPAAGASVVAVSPGGAVSSGRWARLRLVYDRRELVLEVDGVRVASVEETAQVWRVDGPLVLSDPRRPFPGRIDELVVRAVTAGDTAKLPDSVAIAEAPAAIHFAPGGALDLERHPGPVRIVLAYTDGERDTIEVGSYGTVE
jgi:hypothetical protein